jgi:hypothetical protein
MKTIDPVALALLNQKGDQFGGGGGGIRRELIVGKLAGIGFPLAG